MHRNVVEWLVLAVSIVLIAGVVGLLAVEAIAGSTDARVRIELAGVGEAGATGWTVPAVIRNEGGEAAHRLVVEASASVDGATERSSLTVDLLPADSEVEVVFGFSGHPEDDPTVRVVGWEVP